MSEEVVSPSGMRFPLTPKWLDFILDEKGTRLHKLVRHETRRSIFGGRWRRRNLTEENRCIPLKTAATPMLMST